MLLTLVDYLCDNRVDACLEVPDEAGNPIDAAPDCRRVLHRRVETQGRCSCVVVIQRLARLTEDVNRLLLLRTTDYGRKQLVVTSHD